MSATTNPVYHGIPGQGFTDALASQAAQRAKTIPPIAEIDDPAVREAAQAFLSAREAANAARAQHDELSSHESQSAAQNSDVLATAKAIESGKADPGDRHVAELEKKVQASARRLAALRAIEAQRHELYEQTFAQHRAEWAAIRDERTDAALSRFEQATSDLSAATQELIGHSAMAAYLNGEASAYRPGKYAAHAYFNGERVSVDELVTALSTIYQDAPQRRRGLSSPMSSGVWTPPART